MSLPLSYPLENNNAIQSTPLFQHWGPTTIAEYYWSNAVAGVIMPSIITFRIRDTYNYTPLGFFAYRLLANQTYVGTTIPFITPDSVATNGYPTSIDEPIALSDIGTTFDFLPEFQNLSLLPVGTYDFKHNFTIQGLTESGDWIGVSSFTHTLRLYVSDSIVQFTPSSLQFNHTQGATLPSRSFTINGNNWNIIAPPNFELSSATPGVSIVTVTPTTGNPYQTAIGTGEAVIDVTLTNFFDGLTINPSELFAQIGIFQGLTNAGYIALSVTLQAQGTFTASPTALSFQGVKDITEPTPLNVLVFSSEPPYTIEASPWLIAQIQTTEINGIQTEVLNVVPIPTANMNTGTYEGNVLLTDTIDGEIIHINIPVTYTLQDFVQSPYPSDLAFTLDPFNFLFSTATIGSYFQLEATIRTFDFFTNAQTETIIKEKLPLFNGKAQLNYGKTIHRLMNKFSTPNENQFQYKPAELSISISEVFIATETVIRTAVLQNLKFIAGLQRAVLFNRAFLDFNLKPERVTPNSYHYLNILVPNGNFGLRVYKNGTFIQLIPLPYANGTILFQKINFANYQIGDVIRYDINEITSQVDLDGIPSKTFYILREGKYSNHIIWENEYLLQSAFEFTGGASIKSDFETRTQNLFKNAVEILEIFENTKVSKLTISTGWIIKSSIDTIESLMRSKRAWLPLAGQNIALRPISKTMTNQDTERGLIEFTIEFQINRNYNEETYSL